MEVGELIRRWQAGESERAIARATGLSRNTVQKYLRAARGAGVERTGTPPSDELLKRLAQASWSVPNEEAPRTRLLGPHRAQLERWLQQDQLQLSRVHELLLGQRVKISYWSLRRYVQEAGLAGGRHGTVRVAQSPPGEVAEQDFGRLGAWVNPSSGKRHTVWALVVVLPFSRHLFVWPLLQQTLEAVIEGLEACWGFFGGSPRRLVLDNFPAAVAGPDPLAPRPTRGFLEYSQARGFLIDPARVRHPQDKPHVERAIPYVRERFWKGGSFQDLQDMRVQARQWCLAVAGQRVHGTTRQVPLVVFQDQERPFLLPLGEPYRVPTWRTVTVHPDHHVQVNQALYSVPSATCPPGSKLEARDDRALVRLYLRGQLVKVHSSQPKGGRATDPDDYPPERTAYALRAPERLIRQAQGLGQSVGQFAERLLEGTFPWAKLRQAQKLVRLAERYTPERLDAACARALGFGLVDVHRLERILVLALEQEGLPLPPLAERLLPLSARFARSGSAFDHRQLEPQP